MEKEFIRNCSQHKSEGLGCNNDSK